MPRTGSETAHGTRAARGVVVELCGLPGAGKTSLAGALVEVLGATGVTATVLDEPVSAAVVPPVRAARRLGLASAAALRRPLNSARSATWFAAGRQPFRDAAAAYVQWLALQSLVHDAHHSAGLHLLEEGAVQTLWTARLRAVGPLPGRTAWALLPTSARSDAVLLVDVPVETAAARLARRASRHSRTQLLPPDARREELARGRDLLERLLAACPVPVLRVASDDDRTAAQSALMVADRLLHVAAEGSPGPR